MSETGVLGDIHGNVIALRGMLDLILTRVDRVVFTGDLVDRGEFSSAVLSEIVTLRASGVQVVVVSGNHDRAMRRCIEDGALVEFLAIGGAKTIGSYGVGPSHELLDDFRLAVPVSHRDVLDSMVEVYEDQGLVVTHGDGPPPLSAVSQFHVTGHRPVGLLPQIDDRSAQIDTGCGTFDTGRLTCLLWPSLETLQVDKSGSMVSQLESP